MKKMLFFCLMTIVLPLSLLAQTNTTNGTNTTNVTQFTQDNTNPEAMGWMKGFPPSADKVISATDGSFFTFPALRYSVCHMREFLNTRVVPAATQNQYSFAEDFDPAISHILFTPLYANYKMSVAQALDTVFTDGFIVLHRGTVVYEGYTGGLKKEGTHAVMSMSKSLTGTLGAMLVAEGVLDENASVATYVPELAESAFGDATIRELLDMTTALQYSEDYTNPKAEVYQFSAAGTPCHPDNYTGPTNYYAYLQTVQQAGEHGKKFAYKTINTDALGWVISRVTGKSIPDLLSERIWQPMGAHHDGYYQVDGYGIAFAGGGFNGNLRDLAAFGEMMRRRGHFNGQQIIPRAVFEDIITHADNSRFDQAHYPTLPGWGYRNMWWVTNNKHHAFCARGVYGQVIYIDPIAEMVIVRLASNPVASNVANDPYSLPMYEAIAEYLMNN